MPPQPTEQASLLIFLLVSILLTRIFTATLYSFFQLTAGLLLAPQSSIRVFLGSYGEAKHSLFLRFGRIKFWMHRRVVLFPLSHVDFSDGPLVARNRQILILMAGPAGVLVCSGIAFAFLFSGIDWGSFRSPLLLFTALFALMSVLQILRALLAKIDTIPWNNYGLVMGDGERLGLLFRHGNQAPQVQRVVWHWVSDDYGAVLDAVKPLLSSRIAHEDIYEYAIYACLSEGKIEQGISLHKEMTERKAVEPTDLVMLSYLYERGDNPEQAKIAVAEALERAPGFHLALNQKAWLKHREGELTGTLKDLDRAVRSDPEFATARSNRARVQVESGDTQNAEKDLHLAMKHGPLNSLTYETLAAFHRLNGNHDEATASLATARLLQEKASPTSPNQDQNT